LSVDACQWEVIDINPEHGEDAVVTINVDAGFGLELSPPVGNQPVPQKFVKLFG
jgi:hypothetical protein